MILLEENFEKEKILNKNNIKIIYEKELNLNKLINLFNIKNNINKINNNKININLNKNNNIKNKIITLSGTKKSGKSILTILLSYYLFKKIIK